MHVAMSWIMVIAMWRQRQRAIDIALGVLLALITIAPVFVKQHLLIDVALGVPWGLAAYWVAGRVYRWRTG
jgi:hypothetical protein